MLETRSIASVPHYILRTARYREAPVDPDPRSPGFLAYLEGLVLYDYIGIVGCPPFHQPNVSNDSHRPARAVLRHGGSDRCSPLVLACCRSYRLRCIRGLRRSVQRFESKAKAFHGYAVRAPDRPTAFLRLKDWLRSLIVIATWIAQQVPRAPPLTLLRSSFGYGDPIYDHGDASGLKRDGFRGVTLQIGCNQTVQIDNATLGLNGNGNRTH
jgi:hypothetical protein